MPVEQCRLPAIVPAKSLGTYGNNQFSWNYMRSSDPLAHMETTSLSGTICGVVTVAAVVPVSLRSAHTGTIEGPLLPTVCAHMHCRGSGMKRTFFPSLERQSSNGGSSVQPGQRACYAIGLHGTRPSNSPCLRRIWQRFWQCRTQCVALFMFWLNGRTINSGTGSEKTTTANPLYHPLMTKTCPETAP